MGRVSCLSDNEIKLLESQKSNIIEGNKNLALLDRDCEIISLKMQINDLNIELLNYKKSQVESKKHSQTELSNAQKSEHKILLKALKEKYDITKDNWGYNPDTGEIL